MGPRRFDIHAFKRHGLADQFRDASRCRSATQKQKPLIGELLSRDAQGTENARERDSGRTLDIVIIGANLVAVALENWYGVDIGEIFPLDAAFWIKRLHRLDEFLDERIIICAAHAMLLEAKIKRIIEQSLIIGADIERDG